MQTIHLDRPDEFTQSIFHATFPEYSGRKWKIQTAETVNVASYWDGGSRDYFKFVNLETLETSEAVPQQSAFDRPLNGAECVPLGNNWACVRHSYFCGQDSGLTLLVHPDNATKLLPAPEDITPEQKTVLVYTRGLKSTYNGIPNYRFHEAHNRTGITKAQWECAKQECIDKGWLNKAGAITASGKNMIQGQYP